MQRTPPKNQSSDRSAVSFDGCRNVDLVENDIQGGVSAKNTESFRAAKNVITASLDPTAPPRRETSEHPSFFRRYLLEISAMVIAGIVLAIIARVFGLG
jgi:hypothetical protein